MEKHILEALSGAQTGIALFDGDARIIYANPAWNSLITGVSEEDLLFEETSLSDGRMLSVCMMRPVARSQVQPSQASSAQSSDAHPVSSPASSNAQPKPTLADTSRHTPSPHIKAGSAGTIIVADDSVSNRIVARRILETAGYRVIEAASGQAVLDMMAPAPARDYPDLILMDVEMPDMDGLHTTRCIRNMTGGISHIPIIALSAHISRDWGQIARQSGVNDFISKPVQRLRLIEMVATHISQGREDMLPVRHFAPPPTLRHRESRQGVLASAAKPVAKPRQSASPVLDVHVLEQLYADAGQEGAGAGIEIFINETESRLVDIDHALSRRDLTRVRKEVHVLKSTTSTFGLRQLSELCAATQSVLDGDRINEHEIKSLSQQVVQLAPAALTALSLYRRSRTLSDA